MTGRQFRELRLALRLSLSEYGTALGYQGARNGVMRQIRRYEGLGEELVPPGAATRALDLSTRRGVDWRTPNQG